jgi:hypothetical protein
MNDSNEQLKRQLQETVTMLNDEYHFYSKSSVWTDLKEIVHVFLGSANLCRKLSLEILAMLLKLDPDSSFDTEGSLSSSLNMGWTDIKQSLGIESREDLLKQALEKNKRLQEQFEKISHLVPTEHQKLVINELKTNLEQQANITRNL